MIGGSPLDHPLLTATLLAHISPRVPLAASTLVPIPEGVSDEAAMLAGDILSTGYFCARNARLQELAPGTVEVGCARCALCLGTIVDAALARELTQAEPVGSRHLGSTLATLPD